MIIEETEFYDPISDKRRIAKNIKRQTYTMPDKHGNEVAQDGVELLIIGRHRQWTHWIPYRDFKKHNRELINLI